jgi:hypothetical protein
MDDELKTDIESFADYILKKYNGNAITIAYETAGGIQVHSSSGDHFQSLQGAAAAILMSAEDHAPKNIPKKGPGIRFHGEN